MLALNIQDLSYRYGQKPILAALSLALEVGECVALVAANGQGKTTLFKCCLDLIETQRGRIEWFGVDNQKAHSREPVLFLPEYLAAPAHLSGKEFLDFMAQLHDCRAQIPQLLATAQQLDFPLAALQQRVSTYSKGMRQKLGLAWALGSAKPFLVLDEPFSGLDPKARHQLRGLLQARKRAGLSTLLSTHLLHDVDQLYDRVVLLANGQIRYQGALSACLKQFQAGDLEEVFIHHLMP